MAVSQFFDSARWKYVIFAGPQSKRPRDIRGLLKDEFARVDARSLTPDIFRKHGQYLICLSQKRSGGFLVEHFGNSVDEGIAISLMDRRRWLNSLDVSRLSDGAVPQFTRDDRLSYPDWLDNYLPGAVAPVTSSLFLDIISATAVAGLFTASEVQSISTGAASLLAVRVIPAAGGNASLEMISGTEIRVFEADGTPGVLTLHV